MGKRLSDDEKRVFSDQISLLKNENERLTDRIEELEAENEASRELIGRLDRANSAELYEGGNPSWNLKSPLQKEIDTLLTGED